MRSKTYEFKELSDAREVVEHKVPKFMLWFFYFVLVTLTLTLIWSYLGTKEIVVQASGTVKTNQTQSVIPLMNTTILAVHFQEGDMVVEGDLIIEFDGRALERDIVNYENALVTLRENLNLEVLYLESVEADTNLFDLNNLKHVSKYYEVKSYLEVLDVSETKVQDKLTKRASITSNISQQNQTISQYENEIEKIRQQLEAYKVYASFDGILHYVYPVMVGSSIVGGQELLRVHQIDNDELLTVQFYVLNKDITQMSIGQKVRVEIPALSVRTYGYAEAEVVHIESDSRFDSQSGQSFYLVTARLTSNQLLDESIKIGMQVQGRMITDEQRYLFWAIEKLELWIFR
ncbi:efflux RND transporter periplasmic adaptor subunit [Acholeplasma vituli]|uniref:Efflux RND transporter periplasmic adaptor subunit n=1 Tax=Paracholeplasma vituli TaxID=69473 RepID=A0ABT2PU40_9MOLU|nr:efflux RND transporter periplasmic adaptor subunit [Paracholeplasma vituli]MCU0104451.1 efflux RND transporter periplasmic adaptor subunit [Paracholeplasma vituli]